MMPLSVEKGWPKRVSLLLFAQHERILTGASPQTALNKFVTYLRKDKGLEDYSVRKQYKNLLWFTNWALRKGYTHQNTITHYKTKSDAMNTFSNSLSF